MGLPDCYILKSPEPTEEMKVELKELHKLLDSLDFPPCFRHDFNWLKRHLARGNLGHQNYQRTMEILESLTAPI